MEHIEIYRSHEVPEPWALKTIVGGRSGGKTDINPQWRYKSLTEMFGLCGFGWYYEVTRQWLEKGEKGEVCAFVNINLFVKIGEEWSKPIPGNGGNTFVASEKNGFYNSDECFKMATTDALSVACKMIGIAGSIYSGSKYIPEVTRTPQTEPQPKPIKPAADMEIMLHCAEIMEKQGKKAARAFIAGYSLNEAQVNEIKQISLKYEE